MAIFLGDKRISEKRPLSNYIERIGFDDFYKSAVEFFDEHFRGAVTVDGSADGHGFVVVSPFGFAHFFRQLLVAIFGKSVLHIKMWCEGRYFKIEAVWSQDKLDGDKKHELESIGENAGFSVKFEENENENKIYISLDIEESEYLMIYAKNKRKMYRAYNEIFFLEYQ